MEKEFTQFTNNQLKAQREKYYEDKETNAERVEDPRVKEYFKKIKKSRTRTLADVLTGIEKANEAINAEQEILKIPYPIARQIVMKAFQKMQKNHRIEFEFNQARIELLQKLTAYFFGHEHYLNKDSKQVETGLDLKKGIFLLGPTGCGKTLIFEAFQTALRHINAPRKFKKVYVPDIYDNARINKETGFLRQYYKEHYLFDDVGFAPEAVKIYGESLNLMQTILTQRSERFVKTGQLTHITSNLPVKSHGDIRGLDSILDDRVISRMAAMFNLVVLRGKDYRRL